ncbi:hypothetical protein F2Q69_00030921, partial [Brassica cretica]
TLVGHEDSVSEIKTHPMIPELVLSASKDGSVRLWNVETGICILIFSGTGEVWTHVDRPGIYMEGCSIKVPNKTCRAPSSCRTTILNCNRWFGDYILSKSTANEILLWQPQIKDNSLGEDALNILLSYPINHCNHWSIKFSCDLSMNYVSIGNEKGNVYVWDFKSCPPVLVTVLSHYQSKSLIRQTAIVLIPDTLCLFPWHCSTILAASEDGTLWRWDVKRV